MSNVNRLKRQAKGIVSADIIPFVLATRNKTKIAGVLSMGKRANVATPMHKKNLKCTVSIDDLYTFQPLTRSQERFFEHYKNNISAILLHGVAGTGKTFIALYKALEQVLDKSNRLSRVIIVRSAVQGRDIGHLPGDEIEKTEVYTQPYVGICSTLFGPHKQAFVRLQEQGQIEFMTTSFLRGITLDNCVVVVDEAQNLNWDELSTIMTRVGENTRILFCGDFRQTDLHKKHDMSGLKKFIQISKTMPSFRSVEFDIDDIVRSDLVKEFILASMSYDDKEHE